MRMSSLWETVDDTISSFIDQNKVTSHVLWKKDVLYAKFLGKDTDIILCGSKTIVSVQSKHDANELEKELRSALEYSGLLVEDMLTKKKRPFKLKIKTIECAESKNYNRLEGNIFLKKSKIAVTKHNLTTEDIYNIIEKNYQKQKAALEHEKDVITSRLEPHLDSLKFVYHDEQMLEAEYAEQKANLHSMLSPNKKYCISGYKSYARNYRVTYNDVCGHRKQTAVGDVLITINGSKVLTDPRITKERSDTFANKHVPIFYLGTSYEYHVYEEDKVVK